MKMRTYKQASAKIVLVVSLVFTANTHAVSLSFPNTNNTVGVSPRYIISKDMDGIHQMDMVVANYNGNTLTILLSDGAGGYKATSLTSDNGVGNGPFSLASGDIDRDTDNDLVVGNFNTNTVSVFKNDGSGTFTAVAGSPYTVGAATGRPHGVDVADINGDKNLDIITANLDENSLSVLLGDGARGFTRTPNDIVVGMAPFQVRAADVDGDMDSDLIVPNKGSNSVTVLLNNGSGTMTPSPGSPFAVGAGPRFVEVSNVVGTESLDLVVVNTDDRSVTILEGNGAGGFTKAMNSPIRVGDKPNHVAVGDLDGDNDIDIVTTDEARSKDGNDTISVLINNGLGEFTHREFPAGERVYGSVIVDLNGDADNDIALVNADNNNIGIYNNVGAGLPPVALPDGPGAPFTTVQNRPIRIPAPGILRNDKDPEGAMLFALKPTQPANGRLRNFIKYNGSFGYWPNPGFKGNDTFKYTINDGSQDGNTAIVTIEVK